MNPVSNAELSAARRREAEASIMAATESLLAEGNAYAELSVERIAAAAGRSRTAFYLYFRDKRELLVRLTEKVAEELYGIAERWWAGADARAELRPTTEAILATYTRHADLLRAVIETSTYDESMGEFWRGLVGRFVDATEERLRRDGVEARTAAGMAFALVWMTERACYQHVTHGRRVPDEALVDALVEIWEGVLPETGAASR